MSGLKMSGLKNVQYQECPISKMSDLKNVRSQECPIYKMLNL